MGCYYWMCNYSCSSFFIIVACAATLNKKGITINEAKDAAMALKPLAGAFSITIFLLLDFW